ncbi:uncharacterized protein LOC112528928 [Cynara cardunculus var. scolymus]|uniref:Uncharacterized protein n=1 Tax=Cynara cardunculus var. scolymus TaxID=59895 RepID=A0A103XIA0_CYNCS|nr:uncharacterized protein LOC112528928 [Cynara cardunculus var. scolymus]XP_024995740.1 uncharacterized protein LOC112528928 [Cynara cardunculus var. scolymus]KVH91218.1 hypothetical protein Ccrd_006771 [Cynara cardunculus var. scolymus]
MASVVRSPSTMASMVLPKLQSTNRRIWKPANFRITFPHLATKHRTICCTNVSPWEPPPVTYAPTDDTTKSQFLSGSTTLFETLDSDQTKTAESQTTDTKRVSKVGYIRWPMWLVGPSVLLATGMVPTLWLPISSIFLGPNIASLLSLTGLDCIFNLGASLFLLMADACSRPNIESQEPCHSQAPFGYRFWNMVATISGFMVPLAMMLGSEKGLFQPQLPPISFAILLGPYLLLLAVQMLTEMLTWHWESPVWLVTPVVYESYRVLQLMRGLKLGAELGAPAWTVHTIRGLVCWWVLVLGVQIMRVAWYAGFTAHLRQNEPSNSNIGDAATSSG